MRGYTSSQGADCCSSHTTKVVVWGPMVVFSAIRGDVHRLNRLSGCVLLVF